MDDELPELEPCPASFDQLVSLLLAWPKAPTMDLWAADVPPVVKRWSGPCRVVSFDVERAQPREECELRTRLKELVH